MALKNSSRIVYKGVDHVDIAMRFGDPTYASSADAQDSESKGDKELFYPMRAVISNEDGSPNVIWKRILDECDKFDHFLIPQISSYWWGSQSNWYASYLLYPNLRKFEKYDYIINTGEWSNGRESNYNGINYYVLYAGNFWGATGGNNDVKVTLNGFDFFKPTEVYDPRSYNKYAFPLEDGILYFSWISSYWGALGHRFCFIPIINKNYDTGEMKLGQIEYYDEYYDEYSEYFGFKYDGGHFINELNGGYVVGNYVILVGYINASNGLRYIYAISRGPNITKIPLGKCYPIKAFQHNGKYILFVYYRLDADEIIHYIYAKITVDDNLNVSKETIKRYSTNRGSTNPITNILKINNTFYYDISSAIRGIEYRHWTDIKANYLIVPCHNSDLKPIRVFFNYKYENVDDEKDYLVNTYFQPYDYISEGSITGYFVNGQLMNHKPGIVVRWNFGNGTYVYFGYIDLDDLNTGVANNSYYFNGFIHHENDNKNIYTQYKEMEMN